MAAAGDLYANATLPLGDGSQTPDEFVRAQSGTTGIPERLCRANMKKNRFVLSEMRRILTSLTRDLDLNVLSHGHGEERGIPISFQAESPVLGLVLPPSVRERHVEESRAMLQGQRDAGDPHYRRAAYVVRTVCCLFPKVAVTSWWRARRAVE